MEIVNRVAESDIEVLDLAVLVDGETVELDIAPFLHRGLVLREKEFRATVAAYNAQQHAGQHVALYCATDAIVPPWAWMLLAAHLEGNARSVTVGRAEDARREVFARACAAFDWERYRDRIVVVKGCGTSAVPPGAFAQAMPPLMAVARKILYGEPCSSVPLWRRPKAAAIRPDGGRPALPPIA